MRRYLLPVSLLGLAWSGFQLYTAAFGFLPAFQQRAIHVSFAIALAFLVFRLRRPKQPLAADGNTAAPAEAAPKGPGISDIALAVLSLACGLYLAANYERLVSRVPFLDDLSTFDLLCGGLLLVLLLEATRRAMGWILPVIGLIFLAYQFGGQFLPGLWGHSGITVAALTEYQTLGVQGIFGMPIGVVGNYVFYFVLLAAFMKASGTGELFNDIALRVTGKYSGGPAKASVASSGAMGMLSGSAVGNVATTGVFTIPLMKRSGFNGRLAGAIESVASTGGQIVPPMMGAAAFIMAEFLGRPYLEVVVAAIVPAIMYYLALFLTVHFYARRQGAARIKSEDLPGWRDISQRAHLLIPLVVLIVLIAQYYSLQTAALWAILTSVIVPYLRKATRVNVLTFLDGAIDGARQALVVTLPAATAGIIVGTVSYSGLGLKLSPILINAGGGILILTILLVGLACLVLGAGMPTVGAYITGAVLLAPAMAELGVPLMAAHMFILYLCVMSMVTPPVALASFAAASISGESGMKTSFTSFRIGIAGLLVPVAFVFEPAIIIGDNTDPIFTPLGILMLTLGVTAIAGANSKFFLVTSTRGETVALVLAGLLLVYPEVATGGAGVVVLLTVLFRQYRRRSLGGESEPPEVSHEVELPDLEAKRSEV